MSLPLMGAGPSAIAAGAPCDFTGSGATFLSSDANGCYEENGTYGGKAAYENENGWWLYYDLGWWVCAPAIEGAVHFEIENAGDTPPTGTWDTGVGSGTFVVA